MKRQIDQISQKIDSFARGKYYFIKNLSNDLHLSVQNIQQVEITTFNKQDSFDLQQIWMIEQIAQQSFQIVHAFSSKVMQIVDNNFVKLRVNKHKNSQTFWIQKASSNLQNNLSNLFIIKQFKHSKKCLLVQQSEIKCEQRPLYKDECNKWRIYPVKNHPLLIQTSIIQNLNSGLVLTISGQRQYEGLKITQQLMSNTFNQRFQIIKRNECYVIKSIKSGLVVDINEQKLKQGNNIIQFKLKDSLNQLWILQQHGKRIYIIRSAMSKLFMLGIKSNSLKDQSQLIITKNQSQAFWRIIGNNNF